jgi:hypothetical protein
MQHPEYLYWAAVILIAGPSLLVNRVAAVIVSQRIVTQYLWYRGWPEPPTQGIVFAAALIVALAVSGHNSGRLVTALFFLPMSVAALCQFIDPIFGWWAVFWLAVLQVLALPFGNDWAAVRARWPRKTSIIDQVLRFAPC